MAKTANKEIAVWRSIDGYPNYQVSQFGEIRSKTWGRWKKIKQTSDKDGYRTFSICRDNTKKTVRVHRLVCTVFHEPPENDNLIFVNHRDGDKSNNYYKNLEWCTPSQNTRHMYDLGSNPYLSSIKVNVWELDKNLNESSCKTYEFVADVLSDYSLTDNSLMKHLRCYPNMALKREGIFFLFEPIFIDDEKTGPHPRGVRVKDYFRDVIYSTNTIKIASCKSGVHITSIRRLMNTGLLINGCVFNDDVGNDDFPFYPYDDVVKSRKNYKNGTREFNKKIRLTSTETGEILQFPTASAAMLFLNLHVRFNYKRYVKSKKPLKGYTVEIM